MIVAIEPEAAPQTHVAVSEPSAEASDVRVTPTTFVCPAASTVGAGVVKNGFGSASHVIVIAAPFGFLTEKLAV